MKILITGGRGFIGTHLTSALLAKGHFVTDVDIEDGDLRVDRVAYNIVKETRPDLVVHLAGVVGRLFGEDDPEKTITTNALGTMRVAQACYQLGARLSLASTSEAFGDHGRSEVAENAKENLPHNLYGLTKRWGEEVARLYYGPELQIFRLSMPYGPGLPAGRGRAALVNFLWNARHGKQIFVHRGATRAWCWIGDTVCGVCMVLEDGGAGVWTIGRDDNETSMTAVAQMCCARVGAPESLINEIDAPANQTLIKRLETKRLQNLGWVPKVELSDGIARTYRVMVDWYDRNGRLSPGWRP